jgi:hypothetical protein
VGPGASLDGCGKSRTPPRFEPPTVQLVASLYTDYAIYIPGCTMQVQYLRHCATSRKVAVSIPDGVTGFLIDIILSVALWPWGRLSL